MDKKGTVICLSSNSKLRYVREVALAKLLLVDMVIDVDCLVPNIPPQLLHEIPLHACSDKMCSKPMATTMGSETILKAF